MKKQFTGKSNINKTGKKSNLFILLFLLFILLVILFVVQEPLNLVSKAKEKIYRYGMYVMEQKTYRSGVSNLSVALRIPDIEIFNLLEPYRNGTIASLPFIYYGNFNTINEISAKGATGGTNPVELGVLIGCDEKTPTTLANNVNNFIRANITYLIMDCERGPDRLWGQPNVPNIASRVQSVIKSSGYNFRLQTSMQFGYLENKSNVQGGDTPVCINRKDRSDCDFTSSYANQVWKQYDQNDVIVIFGESGKQLTPDEFEKTNSAWVNFIEQKYPTNDWWAVTGMVPKTGLSADQVASIAQKARVMGSDAIGIIYLGRTASEFRLTGILSFLNQLSNK